MKELSTLRQESHILKTISDCKLNKAWVRAKMMKKKKSSKPWLLFFQSKRVQPLSTEYCVKVSSTLDHLITWYYPPIRDQYSLSCDFHPVHKGHLFIQSSLHYTEHMTWAWLVTPQWGWGEISQSTNDRLVFHSHCSWPDIALWLVATASTWCYNMTSDVIWLVSGASRDHLDYHVT